MGSPGGRARINRTWSSLPRALSTGSEEERGLWLTVISWWNTVGVGEGPAGHWYPGQRQPRQWSVAGRGRPVLFNPPEKGSPLVEVSPIHPILRAGGRREVEWAPGRGRKSTDRKGGPANAPPPAPPGLPRDNVRQKAEGAAGARLQSPPGPPGPLLMPWGRVWVWGAKGSGRQREGRNVRFGGFGGWSPCASFL